MAQHAPAHDERKLGAGLCCPLGTDASEVAEPPPRRADDVACDGIAGVSFVQHRGCEQCARRGRDMGLFASRERVEQLDGRICVGPLL